MVLLNSKRKQPLNPSQPIDLKTKLIQALQPFNKSAKIVAALQNKVIPNDDYLPVFRLIYLILCADNSLFKNNRLKELALHCLQNGRTPQLRQRSRSTK